MRLLKRWSIKHQRAWFQNKDGTFYRNCPLILRECKEAAKHGRFRLYRELMREYDQTWAAYDRLLHKDVLDPNDRLAVPRPFREAYPDSPGLWVLDERRNET